MTVFVGALLILAVAAAVAAPLLDGDGDVAEAGTVPTGAAELLEREKSVALLAIKEADFDLAMGKLSQDDYTTLREFYEERALGALDELDSLERAAVEQAATSAERPLPFCTSCGSRFRPQDRFCGSCGAARDVTRD